ncbi:MAG: hemolysin activator protein, HlyB family [Oceanospirillaceae bacterium]|nr:hemolysin activator protein, HlyB family [Oceanospirillaceae bacterium]MBT12919.1 hemolysin activator protein, HlyB family [Oceanospirillaceae bacterium]
MKRTLSVRLARYLLLMSAGLAAPSLLYAADDVNSIRSIFGVTTPDADGDIEDRFRKRNEQKSLAPRENADLSDISERTEGPRILVKKFAFEGLQDLPEFDVRRDEVEQMAERLRALYMKEDKIGSDGYTQEEKDEITEFLSDIGSQKSVDNITREDLEALVDIVREQNQSRGLSFADLEEISNKLSLYFRSHGMFLARVILPAQQVKDGVVTFKVIEGRLGQLEVIGESGYRDSVLKAPLNNMLNGVVTSQKTEDGLYILNDLPGLSVTGAFAAGDNPGETKLKIKVTDEKDYDVMVRLDNYGARFTGPIRAYTNFSWYNPTGYGDSLSIGYLRSEDLDGSNEADRESHANLGQFSYKFPLFDLRTQVGLSAVYNSYAIVDEDGGLINALDLNGTTNNYRISVNHNFVRSRAFNVSSGFAITDKTSEIKSDILPSKDHVVGGEVNFYIDGLSESGVRMLNTANVKLQYGSYETDVVPGQDNEFLLAAVDTSSLFFVPLPFTAKYSRLATNVSIQYSDSSLPSFEQFTMGGASGVRAFAVEDFSADTSVFVSNEWYLGFPSLPFIGGRTTDQVFQAGLLLDFAYGVQNGGFIENSGAQAGDEWARMSAVGLVLKSTWGNSFASKLTLATPLEAKSSFDPDESNESSAEKLNDKPDSVEVFADFNYYF